MEVGNGSLPALGAGQGTWEKALAKQISALACLLLLGFGLSSELEDKMPPLIASEGKRGCSEGGDWALEDQVERSPATSSSKITGCTSPLAAGTLRTSQPIMLLVMSFIG